MDLFIKNATITDKIYFKKEDISNFGELQSNFSYVFNKDILSSLEKINENEYCLPTGVLSKLKLKHLTDNRVDLDNKQQLEFKAELYKEQQEAVNQFFDESDNVKSGLLIAPCSYGKSFCGVNIAVRSKKKTLVLVHTRLLWNQWKNEFEKQSGYTPGMIGDGLFELKDVTIGLYISVNHQIDKVKDKFSLVLVDEVHRCPSALFSETVNKLHAKTKIGLTATYSRKDGRHLLLPDYFSPHVVYAKDWRVKKKPIIHIYQTDIPFGAFNPTRDWAKTLNKLYTNDRFIQLVARIANKKIKNGRCPIILAPRVEFLKTLSKLIPNSALIIGGVADQERDKILSQLGESIDCILSTTIFDEGVSAHRADTLFSTEPHNNIPRLIQRIGRIEREHKDKQWPLVIEFWLKGPIVRRQQANRYGWYRATNHEVKSCI